MSTFEALAAAAACKDLAIDADIELRIVFPGGAVLEIPSPPGIEIAGALDYAKQMLAAASAALMPLQPIFNIIDMIMAIVEFCKAVPDAIASLSPGKIIEVIPKLTKKLDVLLSMIPPLSIPILIKGIVKVVVVMLVGLRAELQAIVDLLLEASAVDARAALVAEFAIDASLQLGAAAECVRANAKVTIQGLAQGLKPLDQLLKLIKLFVDLIGLPIKVPTLESLGEDAGAAIDVLDALITVLSGIEATIVI